MTKEETKEKNQLNAEFNRFSKLVKKNLFLQIVAEKKQPQSATWPNIRNLLQKLSDDEPVEPELVAEIFFLYLARVKTKKT